MLLRAIASGPAAAEQTLRNGSELTDPDSVDVADMRAVLQVLDTDLDDTTEGEDTGLASRGLKGGLERLAEPETIPAMKHLVLDGNK